MERVLSIGATVHCTAKAQRISHPEYFLWGFVRHPCDRILSAYYYECRMERRAVSLDGLDSYLRSPPRKVHTKLQSEFTHSGSDLVLDFVGRFESIDVDFATVCERIAIEPTTLPVVNRSDHPPWTQLLTSEMIRNTRRNYAADFDLFGYDPFTPATSGKPVVGDCNEARGL